MNTEELTAAIADEFQRLLQAPSFSAMRRRAAKDVTFAASQEYADAIGETLAKACRKYITDEIASEKMTKEKILAIKDTRKRLAAIRENLHLFSDMIPHK